MIKTLEEITREVVSTNRATYKESDYSSCGVCGANVATTYRSTLGKDHNYVCRVCDENATIKARMADQITFEFTAEELRKDAAIKLKLIKKADDTAEVDGVERQQNVFFAFLHGVALIAWVPLTWAISGDLIIFFFGSNRYVTQFQWGFAVCGIAYNGYQFVKRLRKAGVAVS